jgi:hypothetical protein
MCAIEDMSPHLAFLVENGRNKMWPAHMSFQGELETCCVHCVCVSRLETLSFFKAASFLLVVVRDEMYRGTTYQGKLCSSASMHPRFCPLPECQRVRRLARWLHGTRQQKENRLSEHSGGIE